MTIKLPLKYSLLVVFTLFLFIFSVFMAVFLINYFSRIMKREITCNGQMLSKILADSITEQILTDDYVGILKAFEEVQDKDPAVAYIFVEKEGRVIVHTFTTGFPTDLLKVIHGKEEKYVEVTAGQARYLDFAAPVLGGRAGYLRLGIDTRPFLQSLTKTGHIIILVTFAGFGILVLVCLFISRLLVKPLDMLRKSAIHIAGGHYTERLDIAGSSEVTELAAVFNQMIDAIQEREKRLNETNERLDEANRKLKEQISILEQTRDELVQARQDAAVVETAGTFLHHIRQPLTVLIGALDLLNYETGQDKPLDMESLRSHIAYIRKAGLQLTDLLNRLSELKEYRVLEYTDGTRLLDIRKK